MTTDGLVCIWAFFIVCVELLAELSSQQVLQVGNVFLRLLAFQTNGLIAVKADNWHWPITGRALPSAKRRLFGRVDFSYQVEFGYYFQPGRRSLKGVRGLGQQRVAVFGAAYRGVSWGNVSDAQRKAM